MNGTCKIYLRHKVGDGRVLEAPDGLQRRRQRERDRARTAVLRARDGELAALGAGQRALPHGEADARRVL